MFKMYAFNNKMFLTQVPMFQFIISCKEVEGIIKVTMYSLQLICKVCWLQNCLNDVGPPFHCL